MTRLALAKTIVSGTVTLQGNPFTFTASGSGTATADKVPEAKKLAVAASNTAAILAARASINQILVENSAVLSDLEITSLISNNLSTTVVVFKPIALSKIASSSDGVNYSLNENVTIGTDQTVTIPAGKTLIGQAGNPFTNNGNIQIDGNFHIGDPASSGSKALKSTINTNYTNNGTYNVSGGGTLTISFGVTFTNSGQDSLINNEGTIANKGSITNSGQYSSIYNSTTYSSTNDGIITNSGQYSNIYNDYGTFNNNETITNNGSNSYIYNSDTFYNTKTITNIGQYSYIKNEDTFLNTKTITNSGSDSYINNDRGTFYNNGTITNSGSKSYTKYGAWPTGTCSGNCYT
jgi:hypothetical protein